MNDCIYPARVYSSMEAFAVKNKRKKKEKQMRVIDITMLFGKLPNNVHFAAPPSSVPDT